MRTSPRQFLIIALVVFATGSVSATTVWKWVDKKGVTHYSDQPVPGAVQVNFNAQTYSADEATIPPTDRASSATDPVAASSYDSIQIASPANEETLTGTGGQVLVSIQVQPEVRPGDSLQLIVDGQLMPLPGSSDTSLVLKDVARGAHSLSARVISQDGRTIIQSSPITFHVQQQSVLRQR